MAKEYTLQESVSRAFLGNPDMEPSEMSQHLQANYNSVKAAFSNLYNDGLLDREGRGNYVPNVPKILLHIMDRIGALENSGT